jgi:hypothetical protein
VDRRAEQEHQGKRHGCDPLVHNLLLFDTPDRRNAHLWTRKAAGGAIVGATVTFGPSSGPRQSRSRMEDQFDSAKQAKDDASRAVCHEYWRSVI